jgi:hypothetical protein
MKVAGDKLNSLYGAEGFSTGEVLQHSGQVGMNIGFGFWGASCCILGRVVTLAL